MKNEDIEYVNLYYKFVSMGKCYIKILFLHFLNMISALNHDYIRRIYVSHTIIIHILINNYLVKNILLRTKFDAKFYIDFIHKLNETKLYFKQILRY